MSMYLEFEPHSWYGGAAIKSNLDIKRGHKLGYMVTPRWQGYLLNGMTGYIVDFEAETLKDLKKQIKDWHIKENKRIARLYEEV